jgi:hypothetical protein
MSVLDRFETQAGKNITIDSKIKCDNYESVGQLKLIRRIRKAVADKYRHPQNQVH